jgi:hypothetical protein
VDVYEEMYEHDLREDQYEACESHQIKKLQMIEKESRQSHRKVGQVKRCDEAFCLHCSRAGDD